MSRSERVLVFGAGIAGLTAAHELAERGFSVEVFEARPRAGGKARSDAVAGSARDGRRDLPNEHGFRFFPGFYRHVLDTMARIPYRRQRRGVRDNLIDTSRSLWTTGARSIAIPTRLPRSLEDANGAAYMLMQALREDVLGIPRSDMAGFARALLVLLSSCEERRFGQYEQLGWWDFVGAEGRSMAFRKFVLDGLSRCLVAVRGREISTRTGGSVFLRLLFDGLTPGGSLDRVLCGPTNDVWIDPWIAHLRELGVRFHFEARLGRLELDGDRVTAAHVETALGARRSSADHYLVALPLERARELFASELCRRDPQLSRMQRLRTAWMNGVQYYLDRRAPFVPGHVACLDSPWALTALTQAQFWRDTNLADFGDGRVRDVLSVDVSDWDTPGVLYGKPARRCGRDEIRAEVWAQLRQHVPEAQRAELDRVRVIAFDLDPAIVYRRELEENDNHEPLFINVKGSWHDRPDVTTRVENLFLAGDYVKTRTDLASMEGANESARSAVNALCRISRRAHAPCALFTPEEPRFFAPLRQLDLARYQRGLCHAWELPREAQAALTLS